ncbi:MAG: DNA-formamidopyrimidine glycosylase family protein, partial [Acidimicrobiales bacterium]
MPELPEVEVLCRRLEEACSGRIIEGVDLASFSALKTFDPPLSSFAGRVVGGCRRRGKFICIDAEGQWLVVNLARSGWIRWRQSFAKTSPKLGRGPLALRVRLEGGGGFDVTEMSTEKRLAIFAASSPESIEAVSSLGPEPLDPSFTSKRLGEI